MSTVKTGGPAFPFAFSDQERISDGMTLRDYFAAKAMILAIESLNGPVDIGIEPIEWEGDDGGFHSDLHLAARLAYLMADAMLKARQA